MIGRQIEILKNWFMKLWTLVSLKSMKAEVRADIGLELEICRAGQQAGRKLRQDFYVDSYHNVKVIYFTQNLLI